MSEQVVNLFDMDVDDASLDFLNKKSSNQDGIFRANPKDAIDKSKGYNATIRFLHNILEDGTVGPAAIEKATHYAKLNDYPDLVGYYDSLTNFGEKCPLTTLYWRLNKSKNQAEVERSELIKKSTKYYSYILVIEDEQRPENEGKIMIFPFGFKISEKIKAEKNGDNAEGKKCNVFDPANGKDFKLIVKEIGGYHNYDSSLFKTISPMKIYDEKNKKFIEIPTVFNEEKGRNKIESPKVQTKVMDFLTSTKLKLSDHQAVAWTEEQKAKVERIVSVLTGNDISSASESINNASTSTSSTKIEDSNLNDDDTEIDNFFGDDED